MHSKTIAVLLVFIAANCRNGHSQLQLTVPPKQTVPAFNENKYSTIVDIPAPAGFTRHFPAKDPFATWLEKIALKKDRTVYLFDGRKKANQSAQFAVLDVPVGNKDLQQCADAVMRLRATYLFDTKRYDSIIFYDNNSHGYHFTAPYDTRHFNEYLQTVFGMCGTASLAKQLKHTDHAHIIAGDVLIRGGFPGHAVIVMDVVVNENVAKRYLLAQSYMPAQDIHVLLNPADPGSPWYDVSDAEIIETPEYTFRNTEWMKW